MGLCKKTYKKSGDITALKNEDGELSYDEEINAQQLNKYFASVFVDEPDDGLFDWNKIVSIENMLPDFIIDEKEVMNLIDSLDISKAQGPDSIHTKVIKECSVIFSKVLTILFNKSLSFGSLPSQWKKANIKALFKKGSRTLCSNYRPVTSVLCKILETIIRNKMLFF